MKFTFIIKFVLILLIPLTILAETNPKDHKAENKIEKLQDKVDQLNEQSVNYLRYDVPKAISTGESALKMAKDINYPKGEAEALINCANGRINHSTINHIINYYIKALAIYKKIGNKSKIAQTLNQLSFNYYTVQKYTKSYNSAAEACKIYEELDDTKGIAYSYYLFGRIYSTWKMIDNAESALNYSKSLYRKIKDDEGKGDVCLLQAEIVGQKGDKNKSKKLYFNAIYLFRLTGNLVKLSEAYQKVTGFYSDYEKDMNKSFYFIDKAIIIAETAKDSARLSTFLTHKGHLYSLIGDKILSLKYNFQALTIREKFDLKLAAGSSEINVGSDYLLLKDYKNAEKHLLIGYKISKDVGVKYFARRAAHMLHGLYRMENKPGKALLYLDSAYKLTLEINQEEKQHQESLINIERKLRFEEKRFRDYSEKKDANQKLLMLIIIALGFSSTLLFFYLYRTKKRDNQNLRIKTKELAASEFRYRSLIDTATDFIYSIDSKGCFISINPAFEKLTGYSVSDYIGKSFESLVYKDDLKLAWNTFEISKKGIPQESYVLRILKKSGDYFYGEFTSKELVQDGKIIGEFGIVRDITSKKIAEDALRTSEERYRVFINSTDDMAFLKDDKFRYMIVNKPYVDFFNKPEQYLLGKTDFELMNQEGAESCYKTDKIAFTSNQVVINEEIVADRIYDTHKFKVPLGDGTFGVGGYIRDITERKYAEGALKKSEELYSTLLATMNEGLMQVDNNDKIEFVNKKICEIFGYTSEELIGKIGNKIIIYNEDKDLIVEKNRTRLNGFSERYEVRGITKSGEIIWLSISGSPILDLQGNTIGSVGLISDITERKKSEESLRIKDAAVKSSLSAIGLTDLNGGLIYANDAYCKMWGYETEQEILGKNISDFAFSQEQVVDVVALLKYGNGYLGDCSAIRKDGTLFEAQLSANMVTSSDGKPLCMMASFVDITERKNAEIQLTNEKIFSDFLIESLPGLFYMFDSNLKPVRWNHNKLEFLGLSAEEMQTHNIIDSIAEEDKNKLIKSIEKTMTIGKDQDIIRIIRYDGEMFSYHLTGKRLETEAGTFLMGVGIDVTDRVKTETELITAKVKAEESERLKSSFLANMSHELRTPMVGILGFSQLLSEVEDLDKAKEMADVINTSGKRLMETLNLILDLARIEAGESEVEISEINLVEAINDVIIVFEAIAKTKNLKLQSYSKFDNYITYSSPTIIASILNNLINNAIKFTNVGSIIVTLEGEIINGQNYAIIKVSDTGIGISTKDIENIFHEFRQASEGLDRSHEGTGLGLTLCKKYVEMLNGSISVESSLGVGTVFTIKIPDLEQNSSVESIDVSTTNANSNISNLDKQKNFNLRILVVDDDPTSLYLVDRILSNQFFIDFVSNSVDAIEKVKENQYSLILMDINLGKSKNGLFATSEIRKLENYRNIPIIAMTAYAMAGDREEFLLKGCTGYISKPFEKKQLIETICEFI
ncbi:MAG: PAS domain S-box protein [bacterium]